MRYLLRNDLRRPRRVAVSDEASNSGADVEGKDFLELLVTAQGACDGWFGLIGERDRDAALALVRREK